MFKASPPSATTALLVAVAIVVATGCTGSPGGITTTSTEHLGELASSDPSEPPTTALESKSDEQDPGIGSATTVPEPSAPGDGTSSGPQGTAGTESPTQDGTDPDADADLTTGAGVELDLSELDAILADLDGLLGDIDEGIGQLGDSFDNDEGDVEE